MRNIIMAGNWKMNKDAQSTVLFCKGLAEGIRDLSAGVKVIVAPPYPFLGLALEALKGSAAQVAAQNVSFNSDGAYTGEVSAPMLASLGIPYCIIGHSERRQYHGETDQTVLSRQIKLASSGITPIICVGETLAERDAHKTAQVILTQLKGCFETITISDPQSVIIAYEPVWAIGTGRTATPEQAQEVHSLIRSWLAQRCSAAIASDLHILYGGSAKPDNIRDLLVQEDIDGALIGGASLTLEQYLPMLLTANELIKARNPQ